MKLQMIFNLVVNDQKLLRAGFKSIDDYLLIGRDPDFSIVHQVESSADGITHYRCQFAGDYDLADAIGLIADVIPSVERGIELVSLIAGPDNRQGVTQPTADRDPIPQYYACKVHFRSWLSLADIIERIELELDTIASPVPGSLRVDQNGTVVNEWFVRFRLKQGGDSKDGEAEAVKAAGEIVRKALTGDKEETQANYSNIYTNAVLAPN